MLQQPLANRSRLHIAIEHLVGAGKLFLFKESAATPCGLNLFHCCPAMDVDDAVGEEQREQLQALAWAEKSDFEKWLTDHPLGEVPDGYKEFLLANLQASDVTLLHMSVDCSTRAGWREVTKVNIVHKAEIFFLDWAESGLARPVCQNQS